MASRKVTVERIIKLTVDAGKVRKATTELEKHVKSADAAVRKFNGDLRLTSTASSTAATGLRKVTDETDRFASSTKKAGGVMKGQLRNVSYQMTDMVVMMSGGMGVMRSMTTQLPQLAAGFGPIGAAVGLAAAAIGSLAGPVYEAITATKSFDDQLKELEKQAISLNSTFNTSFSMSGFIDEFKKAEQPVRATMLSMARLEMAMKQRTATASLDSAMEVFPQSGGAYGQRSDYGAVFKAQRSYFKDEFGFDDRRAEEATRALRRFSKSNDLNALIGQMAAFGAASNGATAEFSDFLAQLQKVQRLKSEITAVKDLIAKPAGTPAAAKAPRAPRAPRALPSDLRGLGPSRSAASYSRYGRGFGASEDTGTGYGGGRPEASFKNYGKTLQEFTKESNKATESQLRMAEAIGSGVGNALSGLISGTKNASEAFREMAASILGDIAKIAATKFITESIFGTTTKSAHGNVISSGNVVPFAKGGIVSSPTFFPLNNGAGLMGEAGPEMIAPLRRNSQGDLGVGASPVNITVLNQGADVRTESDSQGNIQILVSAVKQSLAADVVNGGSEFSSAFEATYGVGRFRRAF